MLKNKIIVRKIRNILILLMAMIVMVGAYRNIGRSRAEDVIEIGVLIQDNYGYLDDEEIVLEAKEIENDLYEMELPESVNTKKMEQIVKVTLEDKETSQTEDTLQEENTVQEEVTQQEENTTTDEGILPQPENAEPDENNNLEIVENKIQLTKEQIENQKIKIEVVYGIKLLEQLEDGIFTSTMLMEKTSEEREKIEITEKTQVLYNKILKYEDKENAKLVEVKGFLPIDAKLQVEEVTQEKLAEIFGDKKIDVAYDIKIIREVITQIPTDEAEPNAEPEEIIETIEINPEDLGETCEVSIKDVKIQKNSKVYHVKEDNTYENITIRENIEENISFEAQKFSIYAVSSQTDANTIPGEIIDEGINATAAPGTYYLPATIEITAPRPVQAFMVTNSTATPQIWAMQKDGTDETLRVTISKPGKWYIHIKHSYGEYYEGPFIVKEKVYTGGSGGTGASSGTQSPTDTTSPTISLNGLTSGGGDNSAAGIGSTITASDYGGVVTNYNPAGVDTDVGWKIFYSDSDNIYLIADYFVDVEDLPNGRGGSAPNPSGNRIYDVDAKNIVNDYTGTADVTVSNPASKWLSGYLQNKYSETTYNCDRWGAYLLDTSVWSVFKDSTYAEYVIGGPTLELFAASYNATSHSNSRTFQVRGSDNGRYEIKWSTMSSYTADLLASSGYGMDTSESLYVAEDGYLVNTNAYGMWFATTAVTDLNPLILTSYGDFISYSPVQTTYAGIRPVVCLKSGTALQKQGNGTYIIVEPDNPNQYEQNTENINGNSIWKKTHEVTVQVEDTGSGLATGTVLQYAWQESTITTTPTSWSTVSFASYSAGTQTIQATISKTGITGKYRLWIKATTVKDVVGNTNSDIIKTGEFWFDNTAPTATGITLSATYTNTGKITATANGVTDNHSGTNRVAWYLIQKSTNERIWSAEASTGQWYKSIDVSSLSEGWYRVGIVLYDNAGNSNDTTMSTSASPIGWIEFCYDKTVPTATGLTLSATYTKTGKITATATGVTDNLSGVNRVGWYLKRKSDNTYVWSGEASTGQWYKSIDVSSLSEGWYRVAIVIWDNAGNFNDTTVVDSASYIGWIEFCYDKTAPTLNADWRITSASGDAYSGNWTNQDVYANLTFSDANSGINKSTLMWKADSGSWATITANTSTSNYTDSWKDERNSTVYYKISDIAGNETTITYTVKIDKTPPTGTITASPTTYEGSTYYTNQDSFTAYVEARDTGGSELKDTTPVKAIAWAGGTWVSKHTTVNGSYNSSTDKYSSQFDFSNIVHTSSTGSTGNGEGKYNVKAWIYDNAGNSTLTSDIYMIYDKTAPTISVSKQSCTWRKSTLSTTITVTDPTTNAYDGQVSGLSTSNSYQYYLSNSPTALNGGSWTNYTSGTAISLNPGIDGEYYLFVRRVNDKAGNKSTSGGTSTKVSTTTYQRFGPYRFDYTKPAITYTHQSLDIDTSNKTYTMTFRGTDAHYSSGILTLDNLTVLMQNGQLDGSGNPIVYNLKEEPVTLAFSSEAYTGANGVTGYTYRLTISNLEQLEIKTGLTTADYSGIITVAVPANLLVDVAGNKNNQTTITTGVDIPGGLPTDEVPIDVVDPLWTKVSSSVDEFNGTATLTVKGTDTYFDESVLSTDQIRVYVNGTDISRTDGINITFDEGTALEENRLLNGTTTTVQYGMQHTISITGLPTDMEQLKIVIEEGTLVDQSGNENKDTQFILYNYLKWTGLETGPQSAFLGNSSIQRENIANVTFVSSIDSANSTKWDASARGDNSILAWYETNANGSLRVYIGSEDQICANKDSSNLFSYIGYGENCTTTEVITNLNLLKTSHVTNMKAMFAFTGYRAMTSLNLTGLKTGNVTNMREMFNGTGYKNMTTFTLPSTFDPANATDMSWMFANLGYTKMTSMNLVNFDPSNATDMSYMFANCGHMSLTSLSLGTIFDTSEVTDMSYMFAYCGRVSLTSINLGELFDTSNVTNMSHMFVEVGFNYLTTLNLGQLFDTTAVTNMNSMFYALGYSSLTSLALGNKFNTTSVTDMTDMFKYCGSENMTSLDLGPAFTNIASKSSGFLDSTGVSGSCVIYAPEAIYKNINSLKKVTVVYSTNETNPYIPTGFTYAEGNLDTGLVIKDSSGNEYVWVEVPRNTTVYDEIGTELDLDSLSGTELTTTLDNIEQELIEYAGDYRKSGYSDTWYSEDQHGFASADDYNDLKYTMLKSVYKNGGFYIGKYETGTMTARNAKTDALTDAVIQANAYPYNNVTNRQAQEIASGMVSGGYTSSLMFGIQWDLVMRYLEEKGVDQDLLLDDSSSWGYYEASEPAQTGSNSTYSKMGIYDLAGNVFEWTLEQNTSDADRPCTRRGGYYSGYGVFLPASCRDYLDPTYSNGSIGFRVALYANEKQESEIQYTRGTINPKYKPEWSVIGTTITNTATTQKIDITLKGATNANYTSNVTTTLEAEDIKIYIDETELTNIEKTLTVATPATGTYVTHKLTLTNFEEALRQTGKLYKEWSGNITLKIGGRGEATETYSANVLVDTYGNQSMMETDEADGTWIDIDFKDATASNTNTNGKLFADFIKPEVVYTYSETDINHTAKELTVIFTIADKYYSSSSTGLTANDLTIMVDGEIPGDTDGDGVLETGETLAITRTLTSSDITATVDGAADTVVGKQYTLTIKDFEQDELTGGKKYLDYAGVVSVGIPAGKIADKSGNSNKAQTITVGVDRYPVSELPSTGETLPYLPTGFSYVEGNLDTGLVIQDGSGNQYVWVEVPKTRTVYSTAGIAITAFTDAEYTKIENDLKAYTSVYSIEGYVDEYYSDEATGLTEGEYNTQKKKMLKSIYKNGGFYVGRYETGIDYDEDPRMEAGNTTQTPIIKQNAYPYNWVTTSQAQELSESFAIKGYTSSLMFGVQWDLILKYLETKGVSQADLITDSTSWGNYRDSAFNITNENSKYMVKTATGWVDGAAGNKASGTAFMLSTGASYVLAKQNIYDLAGNVRETVLTTSSHAEDGSPRTSRGASWTNPETGTTVHYYSYGESDSSNSGTGFRVALYKDDTPALVDVVNPKWTIEAVDGGIKLKAIDEYFKEATLTPEDITVYVNGVENTVLTKDITSVAPVDILDTVDGVANTVVGKEYTLKFPNLGAATGYTEFSVTSPVVGGTAKYRNDNAGEISIEIAAGTIEDTSGNLSEVAEKNIGNYDATPLEVFKVQSTTDPSAKTETIIFNVTDKNFDKTDLIGLDSNSDGKIDDLNDELTIKIDGIDVNDEVNVQSLSYVEIKTTVDGVERVVGHQYTLVLNEFVETDAEYIAAGRDYREWSGTVSIEIDPTAAKDLNGNNIEPSTTTVEGDYVDFIAPEVRYTHQETDIDETDKKYIMTFEVTDKYYASGELTLNDLTILMQNGQLDENGDPIIYNLKDEPVTLAFNATAKGTIGHTYTLTISDLEKFEIKTGLTTADYSGIITVAIAADKIIDDANNKNAATTITTGVDIPGGTIPDDVEEIDVVDPIWTKESGTIDIGASPATATLTINGTDTYFESGELTSSNIKVYKSILAYDLSNGTEKEILPEIDITSAVTLNVSTTPVSLTETRKKYNSTETETVQYGVQYTVTVSGFPIDAERVRLEIAADTLTDQSGNKNKVNYINIYNTLMSTDTETLPTSGFLGNTSIQRQNIESVTFVSSTSSANSTKWDVSIGQDNSIIAWYTGTNPYQVYIGSNEPIFAHPNSSYLFAYIGYGANCTATQTITGLNLLNTHNVTIMKGMFWYTGYKAMTSLNLGTNFKTSNVTNMSEMFTGCGYNQMTYIDFGGKFDTTNVTDMSWMFAEFGYKKLATLTLPTKFKTQSVTDMNHMFMNCGYTSMTSAILGQNFYTSNVTDMTGMFNGCGYTAMTSLDLGPAFTNIASANTNFVTNTGKSGNCTIYAPESIYKSRTSFKLNSSDTVNTLNYTRGTIIPKYKPEWTVTGTTITNSGSTQKIEIKLEGSVDTVDYTSNVTSTLQAEDITVLIDGTELTNIGKSLGISTLVTETSVTHTLTLTNFEEALRQTGKLYKEWSGNITLKIEGRGEDATTYGKNVLVDTYGNQSMMETDESGTWIDIDFKDATASSQNTNGKLFADFIKPEVVYTYSETDINRTDKTLTVAFTIADKYYSSSSSTDLTAEELTIMIDGKIPGDANNNGTLDEDETLAITRTLTSSDITGTVEGATKTIGKQYILTISDLEQDELTGGKKYLDYAGAVSVGIPSGKIADKSGNSNATETITVGVDNSPEGGHTGAMLPNTAYTTPYLPTGFSYVEGDLSTGLVIQDGSGNQYVWVEVPRKISVYQTAGLDIKDFTDTEYDAIEYDIKTYAEPYSASDLDNIYSDEYLSQTGLTDSEYYTLKKKMLKSVYINGGFYVGRYETGTTTTRTSAEQELQTPVIKQNVYPYIYVTTAQAQELATQFAPSGYTSSLLYGVQWDLIIKQIETAGEATVDELIGNNGRNSINYGNFYPSTWNITNTNAKYRISGEWHDGAPGTKAANQPRLLSTGASETFKKQNIYDLGGNVWEFTLGKMYQSATETTKIAKRGNFYGESTARYTLNAHSIDDSTADNYKGFRVALYKDETPKLVDVVQPVWQLGDIDLENGTIKIQAIDEYFDKVTLTANDITVYVNGVPSAVVQKDITSIAPTNILDTVDGVANTIVGKEYTLKLSNLAPEEREYTTFVPTNLNSLDEPTRETYEYQYRTENGGEISISIAGGTAYDTSGNVNEETDPMIVGNIDVTPPEVYEVRQTQNETAKTETIVFNVTDKNYYESDIIGIDANSDGIIEELNDELTIKIDGVDITDDVNIQSLTYKEIITTVDGVPNKVVGHQYTLVLDGFVETDTEWIASGRDYRELSGTVSIEIAPTASRDITGNTLDPTTTTIIGDYIDFINPDIKYTHSNTDIDTTNKKYTMTFRVTDKYYTSGVLQLSDLTILMYNGQKDENGNEKIYNLQSELPSGSVRLTPSAINTIGHEYTLTIENLEQLVIEEGDTTANYSGVITVAIAADKVVDRSGKGNPAKTITSGVNITGNTTSGTPVEVDVVDPIWERISSSALAKTPAQTVDANAGTGTATMTIQGTDTYLDVTDNTNSYDDSTLTLDEIEVYIDGTKNTTLTPTITRTATVLEESRNVFGSSPVTTETVTYGVEYTITLNGWAQGANQVKIRILEDAIKDETGNGNKATDLMMYNCLESAASETAETSGFLGGSIKRNEIQQVIFVDSLDDAPITVAANGTITLGTNCWDVSAVGDKSILAWTSQTSKPYTVYVGSDFEIFANQDSSYLFSYIGFAGKDTDGDGTIEESEKYYTATATETISNIGALNVASVTSMKYIFNYTGYTAMTSLTLPNSFNTSNVTDMSGMFASCGYIAMTSLSFGSNFDTSNVKYMNSMFSNCGYTAMTSLTLPTTFNTSNVESMRSMFARCGYIAMTSLSLGSSFDTGSVNDMTHMFNRCGYTAMTSLSLGSNFDTSNVETMREMFNRCGYTAMTSLNLGLQFDTSQVTDMRSMFSNCGYTELTSLDLGDKFFTTQASNMAYTFLNCGKTKMTQLDLGPAFTRIPSGTITDTVSNEDIDAKKGIFNNTGKSGCVIYATEAIYSSRTAFKVNSTSTTKINYTIGTINPKYRTEWVKETTVVNKDATNLENSTIAITLRGQTISTTPVEEYIADVTSSLGNDDVRVFIDGTDITDIVTISVGTATQENVTKATGITVKEVLQTVTLSGFEDERLTGDKFKEWSGNISLQLSRRSLTDVQYGNGNLAELDNASNEWIKQLVEDETTSTANTNGKMFADFIKPEFTYEYSETTIGDGNHGNTKILTVVFYVADKYFDATNSTGITLSDFYNPATDASSDGKPVFQIAEEAININVAGNSLTPEDVGTGIKYTLVVKNLEERDAEGFSDGYTYSGVVSITIPADKFQDYSGNKNAAKTITIGIDDPTTGDGHNTAVKVDLVDPIWQLGDVDLDNGIIKLQAIDKYFSSVTIDEDDIFVYVNGRLDGDTNNNGVIDGTETSKIVKDITSTTATDIKDTIDGVPNTVVGKEYTLKLSNIQPDSATDDIFVPTNLNELDAETRDTYVYKYKSENGGNIAIKIAEGTAKDTSGNGNKLTPLDVGNIDATNPGIYEVRKTQNAAGNTEKIVFNVTDKNFDPADLITKTEMALSIDNTNVAELLENATLGTPVEIKTTVDGTPNVVVGHQYTIVISNIAETTKQEGKDYLEWSGTLNLTINANAAKDLKGNMNAAEEITDFIDYVKPQLEQVTVANPINTSAKTYTMSFKVLDKYLDTTDLIGIDTDSDGDIDNLNNELTIKVDGEIASDIIWNLTYSPITEIMNKTVEGAVVSNTYTIGHTYTLVLSGFEQSSKQTASGKDFFEWSGTVSVEIAGTAVKDDTGNNLPSNPTVVNGEHVDFIKPRLEKDGSTSSSSTETITFSIMDKYLDTTNPLETSEFKVYVDGEEVTVDYDNSSSTGLNGVFTKVQDFKYTVNSDTNHIVGQQYKLVLSGFDQISRNSKQYKDYSGTVSIELNTNAVDDTSNNTLETTNTTVTGDFVDYIKPDIEYTHQDSDVSTSNKTYSMTFTITDKYYSLGVLTLEDITGSDPKIEILMQNGQLDGSGNPIIYNLKNEPVGIALSATEIKKTFNKTVSGGAVVTGQEHLIGHEYTLTISHLEQLEIKTGLTTADYSGVITVSIAADTALEPMIRDTSNNGNTAQTLTSGVDFVGGTEIMGPGDPLEVDLVDPLWEKVSSSALAKTPAQEVNSAATTGTATITIKGTDTYLDVTDTTNSYDDSTLTTDEIEVYIDGVKTTSITPTITTVTPLTETRRVYDFQDATDTETVQYGVQYTMTVNGWRQNANQIKIKILEDAIKDKTGNGNKATEFIIYNCLESSTLEITRTAGFLDGNGVGERNADDSPNPTTGIKRGEIQQVIFVNNLDSAPITVEDDGTITLGTNCWDVSAISDKSILAWTPQTSAPYTVYIGSNFEIFAHKNSSYLFSYIGCANMDTDYDGTPDETYYTATATDTISNIGALNVSSAIHTAFMFHYTGYTLMDTLDLGDNFDTSNVTNMQGMFNQCGYMAMDTFDLGSNFDTANVTLMDKMFLNCGVGAMPSLNLGDKFKTSKVTNMSYMFSYTGYKEMTSISFGDDFNTSLVTDMSHMFSMCGYQKLETLDLRPSASATEEQKAGMFNTSSVTTMTYMFNRCGYGTGSGATATGLTNLYLGGNFDTTIVTDMSYMFSNTGLTKLASLDLGGKFDTSSVENMEEMFAHLGYIELISLNLGEKFNTTNVTNMKKMFYGTGYDKLESLDLGDLFYTTNVQTTKEMFGNCGSTKMKVLDLGPAFTRIPDKILDAGGNPTAESANTDMFTNCGTSTLIIYAPESIYSDRTGFKLNN